MLINELVVTASDIRENFERVYIKCQTAEMAKHGFQVSGIYPIESFLMISATKVAKLP